MKKLIMLLVLVAGLCFGGNVNWWEFDNKDWKKTWAESPVVTQTNQVISTNKISPTITSSNVVYTIEQYKTLRTNWVKYKESTAHLLMLNRMLISNQEILIKQLEKELEKK